jgi:hypothetical protein
MIRRLFVDNLTYKILALVMTFVFVNVVRRQDDTIVHDELVRVLYTNIPPESVLTEPLPPEIRVRLEGTAEQINKVVRRKELLTVDLKEKTSGDEIIFDPNDLRKIFGDDPPAVRSVDPRSVIIDMEDKVQRRVRVRPEIFGEPARGYYLERDGATVTPEHVSISGAKSLVDTVEELVTESVSANAIDRDLIREGVRLRLPRQGEFSVTPETVTVRIPVKEIESEVKLPSVPIEVRGCQHLRVCTTRPATAPVILKGPLLAIERIRDMGGQRLLFVDVEEISVKDGVHRKQPVRVEPRENLTVLFDTKQVTVEVTELQPALAPKPRPPAPQESPADDAPTLGDTDEP